MKCEAAILLVGLPEADPRAAEMRAHIRACAKCRAMVDHQNNVRALFALKRYEQPPAGFSERCAAQIRLAVEQRAVTPLTWWQALGEHWDATVHPARLAAAAVLLLVLGLYFLIPTAERPTRAIAAGSAAGAPDLWAQIHLEPAKAPATAAAIHPEPAPVIIAADSLPLLMAGSNNAPLRMDYGPGAAVPVKFEY